MRQTDFSALLALEQQIAAARRKMETLYAARGYTDELVLTASIELDELLNRHYRSLQSQKAAAAGDNDNQRQLSPCSS